MIPGGRGPLSVGPGGRLGGSGALSAPYSIEKVLAGDKFPFAGQGGTDYHWHHGVDFLTALKDVQRFLEELELCILELEQELPGLKEPSVSDSETELCLFQTTGLGC